MALPDPALALLDRQHGVVGRTQLLDHMPRGTVESMVDRGHLVVVERGVYAVRGGVVTRRGAARAALIRARPDARLTGPFVLGLFDLDGFTERDPFEVLTAPGRRLRGVDFAHRPDPTPTLHRARMAGLPITDVTAALVDTAARPDVTGRRLRVALDQAGRRRLTNPRRLLRRARTLPTAHPGVQWVLDLDAQGLLGCDSEEERVLGGILMRIDPRPEPQGEVAGLRVDWLWRSLRFGVEYQGGVDHDGSVARAGDDARRRRLADHGFVIAEVHADELAHPGLLARRIHARLVLRAAELDLPAPGLRVR